MKRIKWITSLFFSIFFLLLVSTLSFLTGPSTIMPFPKDPLERAILYEIRLPRILLGFAAGGSLSLSGAILQGIFRNSLVEPYTLGISGGAAIGVCIGIALSAQKIIGFFSLPTFGFFGSFSVLFVLLYLSGRRAVRREELLLSGVMISFISSSIILLFFALLRTEEIHKIIFWMMGSLQEEEMKLIAIVCFISTLGLLVSYIFSFDLNALSLGEEEAMHLGINVIRTKRFLLLLSSFLTGLVVSVTGIIGFVGLVIPHTMRLIFGSDYRFLLFSSFFFGASFLILCDTIARAIIAPSELPVGVVTGVIGGTLFLYLLLRGRKGG
jgi:iron complex transport system permease protein